ncbi:MAG TPA: hypothetical protein VN580_13050 [Clostridia bacterium]|nr:hypothetical protein [Clostridia bacterium]
MSSTNLFFYKGEGKIESRQLALTGERTVVIMNEGSELVVDEIRNIEISHMYANKVKIKIGPKVTYYPLNKKIAVNEVDGRIIINIVSTEEEMKEFEVMADAQLAKSLRDYIHEHVPNLFSIEALSDKSLSELKEIKEKMDDLANSY